MKQVSIKSLLVLGILCWALGVSAQKYAGGDLSMLPKYEAANVQYKDPSGQRINDMLGYLKTEAGFNIVRVRLFVNPSGETGVCQDLDYVKSLGKRVKEKGMKLLLDFHYSDTWADPSNQWTPAAWGSLSDDELYQKIYDYTKECLEAMNDAGAMPDFIQTGNEISYGMLWGLKGNGNGRRCYTSNDANWERFRTLLAQAGKACREVCPEAKIIIHTERAGNWSTTRGIYERLASVDYDIIGLSYYPEWHNSISVLKTTVQNCHSTYPEKDVMIVETGYYNNWYPSNATYDFTSLWPASAEGQKKFLDDLVTALKDLDYVTGLLYWFPEENPFNNRVYEPWYNHGLFNPSNGRATDGLFSLKAFRGELETTGIEDNAHGSITSKRGAAGAYNLEGRRCQVAEGHSGAYIVDGRKVMMK